MEEIELDYETLFEIISLEEKTSYTLDKEYLQDTNIEVKDEYNNWIGVKGLITKSAPIIHIEIDVDNHFDCATTHLVQMADTTIKQVHELELGDKLSNAQDSYSTITNIATTDETEIVYDIEVDSETHLYQIANGTIHHNTLLTSAIIKYANEINMRTITIVPSSSLLKQTHDYIKQFDIPVGMFGGGKKDDEINMVCTWQTLQNNKPFIRDFECIIWDECLHPDSLITMGDNSKKMIKDVIEGDLVKTYNESLKIIESKSVVNIHKNLSKSKNQKMYKITMDNSDVISLTGNHEVLTQYGWVRTEELNLVHDIISLAEQIDYPLVELYLEKNNFSIQSWFNVSKNTITRWNKILPTKYIEIFKKRTNISTIDELINKIY